MDNNEIYEIANLYGNTNLPINAGSTSYSVIIGLGGSARLTIANSAITAAVDLNMSTKKLLNVATGSDSTDGVNKGQMDTALALKSDNSHTHDDRYHTENREERIQQMIKHYADNREKLLKQKAEVVTCQCGKSILRGSMSNHKKTAIHQKNMFNKLDKEFLSILLD